MTNLTKAIEALKKRKEDPLIHELKVGDRVAGKDGMVRFTGTVAHVDRQEKLFGRATVRRDDKVGGIGVQCEYPDGYKRSGWAIDKINGVWYSNTNPADPLEWADSNNTNL